MPRPPSHRIAAAHDARDELRTSLRHLDDAYKAIDTGNGHEAEDNADGPHPLDAISDARGA